MYKTSWLTFQLIDYKDIPEGITLTHQSKCKLKYGYDVLHYVNGDSWRKILEKQFPYMEFHENHNDLCEKDINIIEYTAKYDTLTPSTIKWLLMRSHECYMNEFKNIYKDNPFKYSDNIYPCIIDAHAADNRQPNCFKIGIARTDACNQHPWGCLRPYSNQIPPMVPGIWYRDRNLSWGNNNHDGDAYIYQVVVYENTPEAIAWLHEIKDKIPKTKTELNGLIDRKIWVPYGIGAPTYSIFAERHGTCLNPRDYYTHEDINRLINNMLRDRHYIERLYDEYVPMLVYENTVIADIPSTVQKDVDDKNTVIADIPSTVQKDVNNEIGLIDTEKYYLSRILELYHYIENLVKENMRLKQCIQLLTSTHV